MNQIKNPCAYKIDGCFMNPQTKLCLIHIYKNASISIRNCLKMRGKYHKYNKIKNIDGLITLCVIRHPINRIVSIFLYMLRDEDYGFTDQHPVDLIRKSDFFINKNNIIIAFDMFLNQLKGRNFFSAVAQPQTRFLEDRMLSIDDMDVVLIQENMTTQFNNFLNEYNIVTTSDLKCDNSTNNNDDKKVLLKYINNNVEITDKIKCLYQSDFELYDKAQMLIHKKMI